MVSVGAVTFCVYFCISFHCVLSLLILFKFLNVLYLCLTPLLSTLTLTPSLLSWGSHYTQFLSIFPFRAVAL